MDQIKSFPADDHNISAQDISEDRPPSQTLLHVIDSCRREHSVRIRVLEDDVKEIKVSTAKNDAVFQSVLSKVNKIEGMAKGLYYAMAGLAILIGIVDKLN